MATLTLTGEELLHACLDDAFLKALVARLHPPFPDRDASLSVGTRFRIASRRFLAWLSTEGAASPAEPSALWMQMFHLVGRQHIEQLTEGGFLEEAARFSAACQAVCARLAALRESLPDATSWREIITEQPLPAEQVIPVSGSASITLRASKNSLLHREDGGVDMVEHCLGSAEASEEDLLRFAINAWLLKQPPHLLRAYGIIEGYSPENDDVLINSIEADPQHLDEVFEQSVKPVLVALVG